jgi:hypothetical protein
VKWSASQRPAGSVRPQRQTPCSAWPLYVAVRVRFQLAEQRGRRDLELPRREGAIAATPLQHGLDVVALDLAKGADVFDGNHERPVVPDLVRQPCQRHHSCNLIARIQPPLMRSRPGHNVHIDSKRRMASITTCGSCLWGEVASDRHPRWPPTRFTARVVALFGVVALLSRPSAFTGRCPYVVHARSREIGIRLALGASRRAILSQTAWRGVWPALGGGIIGLALAIVIARVFQAVFFHRSPVDLGSFIVGAVVLIVVAVGAALGPARHASRVEPATTLWAE